MSALQIVVDGYAVGYENITEIMACAKEAAAELAQLRADLQAARERSTEQARQLDKARNVISAYRGLPTGPKGYTSYPLFDLHNAADEWLAANPAPQEQHPSNGEGRP